MDPDPSHRASLPLELVFKIAEFLDPREFIILLENGILPSSFVRLRHLKVQGDDGNTILHLAAQGEKPAWLDDALAHYQEDSIPLNSVGEKPFHIAIGHHRADIVEALRDAGADLFSAHGMSEEPLSAAAQHGDEDIVRILVRHYTDINPCLGHRVARRAMGCTDKVGTIKVMFDNGVDINHCCSVFLNACMDGLLDLARLFIQYGGDGILNDYQRMAPLQAAVDWAVPGGECITIIEELLAAGASVEGAPKSTRPIQLAARGGRWLGPRLYESTLADLREQAPQPYPNVSLEELNPLFDEILEILIHAGANLGVVDELGNNPFHLCVARGSTDAVQMLLDDGLSREFHTMKNCYGITPLALAIRHGHKSLVKLMSKGKRLPAATAVADYGSLEAYDLIFQKGDRIRNIEFYNNGVWVGECNGRFGLFPSSYVRLNKDFGFRIIHRLFSWISGCWIFQRITAFFVAERGPARR